MYTAMNFGCEIKDIPDRKYISINASEEDVSRIINRLRDSKIRFSGRYSDGVLSLVHSDGDGETIKSIIENKYSPSSDLLLQERKEADNEKSESFLPEIAKLLNTSVSALENRPKDVQMMLTKIYTDNSCADSATIREALGQVVELNAATREAIAQERENFAAVQMEAQRQAELQEQNRLKHKDRTDSDDEASVCIRPSIPNTSEKQYGGYWSRSSLKAHAKKIRESYSQKAPERSAEELERKGKK